ncbi:kelch repeat-containing protein [Methylibium rhizosphaerae]|uniref:kelch repeat-containing protein n=1 Tax=Methylibium rhizosphaerae TaxID=2570323 RepID=UPI0011283209|nr:kelch repeat-containing protein [Methylibium rhizosphaerae]
MKNPYRAVRALTLTAACLLLAWPALDQQAQAQAQPQAKTSLPVKAATGLAPSASAGQSATQLADGSWLLTGGEGTGSASLGHAWIVKPDGVKLPLPQGLQRPRSGHSATLLADGRVLVLGGTGADGDVVAQAEVFDPTTGQFALLPTPGLLARAQHSATLLGDGRVLLAGGLDGRGRALDAAELWNPATGQVERFNARLSQPRFRQNASLTPEDAVLLWGGSTADKQPAGHAELFDANTQRFRSLNAAQAKALESGLEGSQAPAVQASRPQTQERNVAGQGPLMVRFNKRLSVASLNAQSVTLIGPNGAETVKVVAAEQGLLLFVWPSQQLLPASRYTLFINGAQDKAQQRLPLTAIGFDTAALGSAGSATLVHGGAAAAPNGRDPRTAAPQVDPKALAAMQADDELFVPDATHRKGNWVSGKAGRAAQYKPKRPEVHKVLYGSQEWEEGLLDRKWQALGVSRKAGEEQAAAGKLKTRARLGWGDVHAQTTQEVKAAAAYAKAGAAAAGTTALAGQVLRLNGKPLANVTLSINGISAKTDEQGEFLLAGIPAGSQLLHIDGRSANRRDATYGVFEYRLDLQAGQTNTLPFVVWMPKLDTRHAVKIDSPTKTDVTLTHPLLPGFEVTLPAGTVIRDVDGKIVTEVSITPLPVDQTPFPMPYFGVPLYYTLQPGGAVIQGVDGKPRAATVRYPNYTGFGPGAPMRLFDYDPKGRGWYEYAVARVSADGQRVESDRTFQIYQFGATSASSGGPDGGGGGGDGCGGGDGGDGGGDGGWGNSSDAGGGVCGGDPVDLSTGHFVHIERDLFIADTVPIDIRRTYRTMDNSGGSAQYARAFGVGATHPYEMYLYLPAPTYSEIQLVMPNGRKIRFPNVNGTACCYVSQVFQNTDATGAFHRAYFKHSSAEGALILYFKDGRRWAFPNYTARLKWMEDANGNRLTVERPANNAYASRVVSPSGRTVSFTYNTNGFISQITDQIGRSFSYTYDSGGRLTEVTDPHNQKRIYTWDTTNNRVTSIKDPNGHTRVANEYEGVRVKKQTLADGSTFEYAYLIDIGGRLVRTDVKDRRGSVRRVEFDTSGLVAKNTFPLGQPEEQVTTYEVANGLTLSMTDALNRKTAYEYDGAGNPTKITRLAGTANAVSASMTWDATLGRPLTMTNANGRTTTLAYDLKGNLTKVTDPLGNATSFGYDPQGKRVSVTNPLGKQTTLGYDGPDLTSVTDPLGRQVQLFTDTVGRQLAATDALGNRTTQEWDSLNRLTRITDALGQAIQFSYDANGNVLTQVDQKGNTTGHTYNAVGQRASTTDALLKAETFQYEPGGKPRLRIDRKGQLSAVSYDAAGRAKRIGFGASAALPTAFKSVVELTWDKGNRLTQIVDKTCANPTTSLDCASVAASQVITRSYDGLDRMTQEVTPQGEVNYTYDAAGRRTSMVVKNGTPGAQTAQPTITYGWDNADRLTSIAQAAGSANNNVAQVVTLAYDAAGRRTQTTLPNGSTEAYTYDFADQLTAITYKKADGTLIGDLTYTYDANGRRTGAGGSLARLELPPADVTDAAYDVNNRLRQWAGRSYSYDDNGNLIADGVSAYQWDERNQLKGISTGASAMAAFQYDSQGRRSGKTINGATTGYVYDGDNFVQELLGTSNTAGVKAQLITGGIDQTFARLKDGQVHSFLTDGNNNTVRLTDQNQAKVVDYRYEPYGATTSDNPAASNSQQYTGRENDNPGNSQGLYYYRARYYMPGCMRFISEDPIGWASGQTNSYAYVGGRPVDHIDPSGQAGLVGGLITIAGAVYAGYQGWQSYMDYMDQECAIQREYDNRRADEDTYTPAQEVARRAEQISNGVERFGPFVIRPAIGIAVAAAGGGVQGAIAGAVGAGIGVYVARESRGTACR